MPVKLAAAGVFVAALAWRFLTFTGFSNDHYASLALAHQMLLGDRPIRDFSDPGWPLQYLVSAAAWTLTDGAILGEWAVTALAFAAGAAFTLLAAHRLSGSIVLAILVTLAEIAIAPRTYSYPKILPYAAAGWAIVSATGAPSRRRIVLLALIVVVAFLFRHDHGLYIGAATAVYVALATSLDGARGVARALATLVAAAFMFVAPWLMYVQVNTGLAAYLESGLEFARAEAQTTVLDYLPAFSVAPSVFTASNADAWLFWLYWSLPVACGGMALLRAMRGDQRWKGEMAAVVALIVLALCVNLGFVRHQLRTRLPDAIVPAVLLGAWALGVCWTRLPAEAWAKAGRWRRPAARTIARVASLVVLAGSFAAIGSVAAMREQIERVSITRGIAPARDHVRWVLNLLGLPHRQDIAPPGRVSETLMPFYAYLDRCSSVDDRLIVTNQSPDVPVLAGRKFAGDGVVFSAGYSLSSVAGQRRTLERLRANPALFVVVIDRRDFRERFPLVDEYVTEQYEPMAIVSGTWPEGIPILVHRARPWNRLDSDTKWRCFRLPFY